MDEHLTAASHISGCNRATQKQEPLWTTVNGIRGKAGAAHFTAFSCSRYQLWVSDNCWNAILAPQGGHLQLDLPRHRTAFGCSHRQAEVTIYMYVSESLCTHQPCRRPTSSQTSSQKITWVSPKPWRIYAKCFTELVHSDIAHSGFSQP